MCEIKETIYMRNKCNISRYGYLGVFIPYFHFIINYNLSIHFFFTLFLKTQFLQRNIKHEIIISDQIIYIYCCRIIKETTIKIYLDRAGGGQRQKSQEQIGNTHVWTLLFLCYTKKCLTRPPPQFLYVYLPLPLPSIVK